MCGCECLDGKENQNIRKFEARLTFLWTAGGKASNSVLDIHGVFGSGSILARVSASLEPNGGDFLIDAEAAMKALLLRFQYLRRVRDGDDFPLSGEMTGDPVGEKPGTAAEATAVPGG